MTATDELRRMLDERGVEWDGESYESVTFWNEETNLAVASDDRDGKLWMSMRVTPAQAIEATLGRGTCRDVCAGISEFTCSSCGFNCDLTSWISMFDGDEGRHRHHHHGAPNYCPNCGRRVQ